MPDIVEVKDTALVPVPGGEYALDVSAAVAITPPSGAKFALIQTLDQPVRWRDDGTAPTATVGMQLAAGESLFYTGRDLTALQLIEEAATAVVNVAYYR